MLVGTTLAALVAFTIARGAGRKLAEKVISMEMDEGKGGGPSPVQQKFAEVQQAIEKGSFWEQYTAITLLRLTPIIPFSASNYILGVTPLQYPAFVGATVTGMTVWAVLYASIGGASRSLLTRGVSLEGVLADMMEKATALTEKAGEAALAAGIVAAAFYFLTKSGTLLPFLSKPANKEQVEEAATTELLERVRDRR